MTLALIKVQEHRSKPRVETKVRVRFGSAERVFAGNLSKSGVFLETSDAFAKLGEKVNLSLTLSSGDDPIKVVGRVTRVVGPHRLGWPSGVAVEFLRIETKKAKTFDRLIDRLLDARGIGCRKYPRMKSQVIVELKSQEDVKQAVSENLSKGGLFLKTAIEGFNLGQRLDLILLNPVTKRKFEVGATIVHLRKGESKIRDDFVEGVGVQFSDLTTLRRTEIGTFLRGLFSSGKRS